MLLEAIETAFKKWKRPDHIICDVSFYEEYRRFIGETIWSRELTRARRQLGIFSSQHKR